MAFVTGSDETCSREFILFPKTYKEFSDIEKGKLLKIRGKVERRIDEIQIIVEKIKYLKGDHNEE